MTPQKDYRLDFFIVFSHGLRYQAEILTLLRNNPQIEILYIQKKQVPDWPGFITELYGCDHVPIEHLAGKTAYLQALDPEYLFILVKNKQPDEQLFGEGEFRHIQCATIKRIKELIRNAYNPRNPDGSRTEHHVIHASDYESQVAYVLNMLGLPDMRYFTRKPHPDLDLPFHVQPFRSYQKIDLPFDDLLCRNGQELVHVRDTFHFQYLDGNPIPYQNYMQAAVGVTDFSDHGEDAFTTMLFSKSLVNTEILVNPAILIKDSAGKEIPPKPVYIVQDGNHRAAMEYFRGKQRISAIVPEPFANKISLETLFEKLNAKQLNSHFKYVVLRRKEWLPCYYAGEDLDILTNNYQAAQEAILDFAALHEDLITSIVITKGHHPTDPLKNQAYHHIDLFIGKELHYRFDIIINLTHYLPPIPVSVNYANDVLQRSTFVKRNNALIAVPNPTDDLIIRYLEYLHWPEKRQHKEYVREYANEEFYKELYNVTGIARCFS